MTATAREFGTVDVVTVLPSLRADASLHAHGDPTIVTQACLTEAMTADGTGAHWYEYGRAAARLILSDDDGNADLVEFAARRGEFLEHLDSDNDFTSLIAHARLHVDEAEMLTVLTAAELDPNLHRSLAKYHGDAARGRYTLGTLLQLFTEIPGHRGISTLGPGGVLRVSGMVSVITDGPWSDHTVSVHPSVVWAAIGDDARDPDLPTIEAVAYAESVGGEALVVVSGGDSRRRREAAAEATAGDRFLVVAAPSDAAAWQALVREATISGSGVIVEVTNDELGPAGRRCIARTYHLPWAITSPRDLALDEIPNREWVAVEAASEPITDAEWSDVFGPTTPRSHPLNPAQVDSVARAFHAYDGDLDAAVRRLSSGPLERVATRIRPRRSWDDLVLSPDRKALLHTIVDRYRHSSMVLDTWGLGSLSGKGTIALFAGPSGTGKTLATEVIAGEIGLDVFKLDLSSVVSKYIGETEKNLETIFRAAGAGNLVLFFDEADALFGKRSEVKDARDRYANIEVSYLLQRLEAYDGLVIMATNFEKNVDQAFLRRIHVRVEFAVPEYAERLAIWTASFPSTAPADDVDLELLARQFEITGGVIRNAAVHAGFIAAASEQPITTEAVVRGVAQEFRKMGRLIKKADFGAYIEAVTSDVAG